MTITHTFTHKWRTKRGLWSVLTKPEWNDVSELFPHSILRVGEEHGWCKLRQRQILISLIQKAGSSVVFHVLATEAFPALLVNTTWPRIHCGGAVSTDCGNRLLFCLCFYVEVRALWAFVCGSSWVGVGFQCDTRYKYNYSSRLKKAFSFPFSFSLPVSLCFIICLH